MTNLPLPPFLPVPEGEEPAGEQFVDIDGDETLDPDMNDDAITSAEADRLAANGDA